MPSDFHGTDFAPPSPTDGAEGESGKVCAAGRAGSSARRPARSIRFGWRILPEERGARFIVQVIDLCSGSILGELPSRELAELPALLRRQVARADDGGERAGPAAGRTRMSDP